MLRVRNEGLLSVKIDVTVEEDTQVEITFADTEVWSQ